MTEYITTYNPTQISATLSIVGYPEADPSNFQVATVTNPVTNVTGEPNINITCTGPTVIAIEDGEDAQEAWDLLHIEGHVPGHEIYNMKPPYRASQVPDRWFVKSVPHYNEAVRQVDYINRGEEIPPLVDESAPTGRSKRSVAPTIEVIETPPPIIYPPAPEEGEYDSRPESHSQIDNSGFVDIGFNPQPNL
jgi:hypothetical protein